MERGTVVDATILHAPSSTQNTDKPTDLDLHQTKTGQQDDFGMKAHIGVDVESGVVHSMTKTAANVADITEPHRLLHGKDTWICADVDDNVAQKRDELKGLKGASNNARFSVNPAVKR